MIEEKNEIVLRCSCHDPTHPLWVYASADFHGGELTNFYLDFAPAKLHTFFQRVKYAFAYIFQRNRPFILYDMFLSTDEMKRFVSWAIEHLEKESGQSE